MSHNDDRTFAEIAALQDAERELAEAQAQIEVEEAQASFDAMMRNRRSN
ncbi:hypothetical protein [Streptomyces sp. NPDC086787]